MSRQPYTFAMLLASCFMVSAPAAMAQAPKPPEPEGKQPYDLQVVLHLADNPALTDTFFDRLERELSDSLQADFGDLVRVKVIREHPLLKPILEKGLAATLKTVTERDGVKTQFVLIDFNGVDYEIQTCQYDGVTGQPNPVLLVEQERNPIVRREKKRDREFVAKAAALLVERDFGLIASFAVWPQGKTKPQPVQLDFKGSALAPLDRWVKKGDVFGVVQVPSGNGASQTIPDAVVIVQDAPKDGACTGQLYWRYELLAPGGSVSYRCVKLGTVAGPLRLRVVKPGAPNTVLQAAEIGFQARRTGFTGEKQNLLERRTNAKGLFDGSDPKLNLGAAGIFDQVAFVSVVEGGGTVRAELPVPILTDQPYLIKLSNQAAAEPLADLAKEAWKTNVNEAFTRLEHVIKDIQQLATKGGAREEIIKKGQAGLDRANTDYPQLTARRDELYKTPTATDQRDLKQMDQQLKLLDKRMKELAGFLAKQDSLAHEEKDPERLDWLAKIEQGKLLENDLEFGKALALYEKVPAKFAPKDLKDHVVQLHEKWDTNDEKFRNARAFIYEVFPTLQDSAAVQPRLGEAVEAFAQCRRVGDTIAPQKLLLLIGQLVPKLQKEGAGLNGVNVDDVVPIKRLKDVGLELDKLVSDLKAYLELPRPPQ